MCILYGGNFISKVCLHIQRIWLWKCWMYTPESYQPVSICVQQCSLLALEEYCRKTSYKLFTWLVFFLCFFVNELLLFISATDALVRNRLDWSIIMHLWQTLTDGHTCTKSMVVIGYYYFHKCFVIVSACWLKRRRVLLIQSQIISQCDSSRPENVLYELRVMHHTTTQQQLATQWFLRTLASTVTAQASGPHACFHWMWSHHTLSQEKSKLISLPC